MNIQAIKSTVTSKSCQPLKPVNFAGKKDKAPSFAQEVLDHDMFTTDPLSNAKNVFFPRLSSEDKFDMACLIAGYYKTQYEKLLAQQGEQKAQ